MVITVGIDPGASGAIAVYDGRRLKVFPMPMHNVKRGKTFKPRIDAQGLINIANNISLSGPRVALTEDVGGIPGQGAPRAFTFGWTACAPYMAFMSAGVPVQFVAPATWKLKFGIRGSKDDSRAKASEHFPDYAHLWAKGSEDGLAEAALIAKYAHLVCLG